MSLLGFIYQLIYPIQNLFTTIEMKKNLKNLIVIPARGGSKGIPRKNLRPLGGKPLIAYSIESALATNLDVRVVVSTDDEEIALISSRFGANIVYRGKELSSDNITLDPVIFDALIQCEEKFKETYQKIITIQPTSPLVTASDIEKATSLLDSKQLNTVLSVVDDRHLCWKVEDEKVVPSYAERLNRQQLPCNYKETGAIVACTRNQIEQGTRFGEKVGICEIPYQRSFDIDNFADLYLCEALLMRKKIVFTVVGYAEVGLGHAFRAVMLANELVQYELLFVCEEKSDLAIEYISSHNYTVVVSENNKLAQTVVENNPDLVINDILDTDIDYMSIYEKHSIRTVNFEDMGKGHVMANCVINALYPNHIPNENVLVGPKYFCLRDEFLHIGNKKQRKSVKKVLITFGGVDEGNLTLFTCKAICETCINNNINLEIILGPAYLYEKSLVSFINSVQGLSCNVIRHTKRISEHMIESDIAITSGGRTVLELASLKVPTIVICQNQRETTHTFASSENGIINLGYRKSVTSEMINDSIIKVISDRNLRELMIKKQSQLNLNKGKAKVISIIKSIIQE